MVLNISPLNNEIKIPTAFEPRNSETKLVTTFDLNEASEILPGIKIQSARCPLKANRE